MNTNDFNLIMDSLNQRITACNRYFKGIKTTKDLANITIADAVLLRDFCKSEEATMTKIIMVDLYHIIGMGNLTPVQMMRFTYKVKEYLSFRPNIKAISNHLDSISDLPKLPVATRFKLMGLCDLVLESDANGCFDEADVEDYAAAKSMSAICDKTSQFTDDLPFRLDGRTIEVDLNRSAKFAAVLTKIFKCPMGEGNFLSRLELKKSYGGIDWMSKENGIATGVVSAENNFRKLEAYYRNYKA